MANNSVDVCVTVDDSKIENAETVMLAKISASDNVFDMRSFATSKVAPCSENVVLFGQTGGFSVYMSEKKENCLRTVLKNVFPGAKYISNYVKVATIQQVDAASGEDLEYTLFGNKEGDHVYAAFNRVGTDVQVWLYSDYNTYFSVFNHYYIF